jgi:hypothetical protein
MEGGFYFKIKVSQQVSNQVLRGFNRGCVSADRWEAVEVTISDILLTRFGLAC